MTYDTETCMAQHRGSSGKRAQLDLHGNHHRSGCPSASAAVHYSHTLLKLVVKKRADLAGFQTSLEPHTCTLLRNQFTADQCRAMFHKQPTKATTLKTQALLTKIEQTKLAHPDERQALVKETDRDVARVFKSLRKGQQKGLRIDLEIVDQFTGATLWIDTAGVHPTCHSKRKAELKRTWEIVEARQSGHSHKRTGIGATPAAKRKYLYGKAVEKRSKAKHKLYLPLVTLAAKQKLDGKRGSTPTFIAAIFSTIGELGPDTIQLQETIIATYKDKIEAQGDRPDGYSPQQLTAIFRNDTRIAFQIAVAKGVARMLREAGLPRSSCSKHITETNAK
jgi:hypothetical protein